MSEEGEEGAVGRRSEGDEDQERHGAGGRAGGQAVPAPRLPHQHHGCDR